MLKNFKQQFVSHSPCLSKFFNWCQLFSHIQKYSWMLERKCVKSYRPLQHCSSVTRFKQVENQSRNHALRKRTCCQCMHGNGNSLFCVYGL